MGLILSYDEIKTLISEIKDDEMFDAGEEVEKLIEKIELKK